MVIGGSTENFVPGEEITIATAKGPTDNLMIDYISALIIFNDVLVRDPAFQLKFRYRRHGWPAHLRSGKLQDTSAAHCAPQIYVVSQQSGIFVEAGINIAFLGTYLPDGVGATVSINLSFHYV